MLNFKYILILSSIILIILTSCSDPMRKTYNENTFELDIVEIEKEYPPAKYENVELIKKYIQSRMNKSTLVNQTYMSIFYEAKVWNENENKRIQRETDSLTSLIAFGNLKFGDSEKEVKKKLNDKNYFEQGKNKNNEIYSSEEYYTELGSGLANFKIFTFFYNDELRTICLDTPGYFCSETDNYYIGDTKYCYEQALEYLSSLYGHQENHFPKLSAWRAGYGNKVVTNNWKKFNTGVELSIVKRKVLQRHDVVEAYVVQIWIRNPSF